MSRSEWRATTVLGRVEQKPDRVAEVLAALDDGTLDAARLEQMLRQSKVTRLAWESVRRYGADDSPLAVRLREIEEAEDAWRASALGYMGHALCEIAACGGRVAKGLAVQPYYPDPDLRHLGDVDAHFPSWPAAFDLVQRLRRAGWQWDTTEFPWLKWDDAGVLYGQLSMVVPTAAEPVARVDLHIGPYSVGHAGLMPMVGWRRSETLGVPVDVPDVETSVALTAVHALNDGHLSMKDLNDLHVLIRSGPVDWSSVRELCRAAQAGDALAQCLAELSVVYPDDPVPAMSYRPALSFTRLTGRARARRFAALCYRDERARGTSRWASASCAVGAYRYFNADLRPRTSGRATGGPEPARRRRDLCWRLIPAEVWTTLPPAAGPVPAQPVELASDLHLVTGGRGAAVRLGRDVFVTTVDGRVHPDSVAVARRLADG